MIVFIYVFILKVTEFSFPAGDDTYVQIDFMQLSYRSALLDL